MPAENTKEAWRVLTGRKMGQAVWEAAAVFCQVIVLRRSSLRTDMVDGSSTEFAVELLGPEAPEVMDGERPEVEHIVPGEGISLLQQHHSSSHEAQLHRCPQTAGPRPNDHTLTETNHIYLLHFFSKHLNMT